MFSYLRIEYADPTNLLDSLPVDFKLRDNDFVPKWIERVQAAQALYRIDEPGRFYGFGSLHIQQQFALQSINRCIDEINNQKHLICRRPENVQDQDCLNYLHHVFEVYHGLLDQQTDRDTVLIKALADLNILVHRCESVARGAYPRHVVTWYGLPKDCTLADSDYELFTDEWNFGTVMLNYAEIGKTLEDLAIDNDKYINESAFKPFNHYSADFSVKFWTTNPLEINEKRAKIQAYHAMHQERFGPWSNKFSPGSIPLADLVTPILLQDLDARQYVKSVSLY